MSKSDWKCPECGGGVYGWRTTCYKASCGGIRPTKPEKPNGWERSVSARRRAAKAKKDFDIKVNGQEAELPALDDGDAKKQDHQLKLQINKKREALKLLENMIRGKISDLEHERVLLRPDESKVAFLQDKLAKTKHRYQKFINEAKQISENLLATKDEIKTLETQIAELTTAKKSQEESDDHVRLAKLMQKRAAQAAAATETLDAYIK
jgi:chromosome segregation ATPase